VNARAYDRQAARREVEDIKHLADNNALSLLAKLGIRERPRGVTGYIALSDPVTKDSDPSLVIWLYRPGGLSWKRYGRSAQGDWICLVSYLNGWWDLPRHGFQPALRWLKDQLGVETMTPEQRRADAQRAQKRQAEVKKKSDEELARQQGAAFDMWANHAIEPMGTVAETYIREKLGLDLQGPPFFGRLPNVMRFLPNHRHVDEGGNETAWPCIVVACVDFRAGSPTFGKILAVHRTWLTRDGKAKAPVKPARKVWPSFAGLVIPLWRGDGNMRLQQAQEAGLLQVFSLAEGWEKGLAMIAADPVPRTWCFLSLNNLGNVMLPPFCEGVLLHRDNDWKTFAATEAYEGEKRKLELQGRAIAEVHPSGGKDLDDTLRLRGLGAARTLMADARRELQRMMR